MPIVTHGGFEIPLRSRVGIHLLDLALGRLPGRFRIAFRRCEALTAPFWPRPSPRNLSLSICPDRGDASTSEYVRFPGRADGSILHTAAGPPNIHRWIPLPGHVSRRAGKGRLLTQSSRCPGQCRDSLSSQSCHWSCSITRKLGYGVDWVAKRQTIDKFPGRTCTRTPNGLRLQAASALS